MTDTVIAVRYSETADLECPCCGRDLKWLFITRAGFAGGSGCIKRTLGLKVTPSHFSTIARWTRAGWTVMAEGTEGAQHFELWGKDGRAHGITINGLAQAQGPDLMAEWTDRYARDFD